jgi:hypothetical protein
MKMNSSMLALFAVAALCVCATAMADDSFGVAPLPIPQTDAATDDQVTVQSSVVVTNDGKWNRGMIANDGASFSGAPPYSAPYLGGAWEGSTHIRYPYYSYRRNWDYAGPASVNVTIVW